MSWCAQRLTGYERICECKHPQISFIIQLITGENFSQKSEDNLAIAESELDKQTAVVTDLTRKVEDLQLQADQALKLKDELDEWEYLSLTLLLSITQSVRMRHANDKYHKMENVLDKYKKKLQEASELRQRVKVYLPVSSCVSLFNLWTESRKTKRWPSQ